MANKALEILATWLNLHKRGADLLGQWQNPPSFYILTKSEVPLIKCVEISWDNYRQI
jgi:hypothetical protein